MASLRVQVSQSRAVVMLGPFLLSPPQEEKKKKDRNTRKVDILEMILFSLHKAAMLW